MLFPEGKCLIKRQLYSEPFTLREAASFMFRHWSMVRTQRRASLLVFCTPNADSCRPELKLYLMKTIYREDVKILTKRSVKVQVEEEAACCAYLWQFRMKTGSCGFFVYFHGRQSDGKSDVGATSRLWPDSWQSFTHHKTPHTHTPEAIGYQQIPLDLSNGQSTRK